MLACVGGVGCGDACGVRVAGAGSFRPAVGGRCFAGCGGAGLVAGGCRRCDGMPAAAGGPAVLGRGCERVACEGMWGRRRALAVASGAVFEPGRGKVAVREVLRGAVGVARGEGEAWAAGPVISAMSPWSLVGSCRASLAAVSAAAPWPGWASLVRSDSHLVCSSCCQLQASLLAEVTGCIVERRSGAGFRLGVSAHCFIVCVPVSVGLSRCTAVVLAASLPVGDRGARSGRFFGAWSVDSDKLWCKGIG